MFSELQAFVLLGLLSASLSYAKPYGIKPTPSPGGSYGGHESHPVVLKETGAPVPFDLAMLSALGGHVQHQGPGLAAGGYKGHGMADDDIEKVLADIASFGHYKYHGPDHHDERPEPYRPEAPSPGYEGGVHGAGSYGGKGPVGPGSYDGHHEEPAGSYGGKGPEGSGSYGGKGPVEPGSYDGKGSYESGRPIGDLIKPGGHHSHGSGSYGPKVSPPIPDHDGEPKTEGAGSYGHHSAEEIPEAEIEDEPHHESHGDHEKEGHGGGSYSEVPADAPPHHLPEPEGSAHIPGSYGGGEKEMAPAPSHHYEAKPVKEGPVHGTGSYGGAGSPHHLVDSLMESESRHHYSSHKVERHAGSYAPKTEDHVHEEPSHEHGSYASPKDHKRAESYAPHIEDHVHEEPSHEHGSYGSPKYHKPSGSYGPHIEEHVHEEPSHEHGSYHKPSGSYGPHSEEHVHEEPSHEHGSYDSPKYHKPSGSYGPHSEEHDHEEPSHERGSYDSPKYHKPSGSYGPHIEDHVHEEPSHEHGSYDSPKYHKPSGSYGPHIDDHVHEEPSHKPGSYHGSSSEGHKVHGSYGDGHHHHHHHEDGMEFPHHEPGRHGVIPEKYPLGSSGLRQEEHGSYGGPKHEAPEKYGISDSDLSSVLSKLDEIIGEKHSSEGEGTGGKFEMYPPTSHSGGEHHLGSHSGGVYQLGNHGHKGSYGG